MGIKTLDWTPDTANGYSTSPITRVGAGTTDGPIYDLKTDAPWFGRAVLELVADGTTAGSVCIVTVQGSVTSDFSGNKHTLANYIVGDAGPTGTALITGAVDSTARAANDYVLWFTNQAQVGDRIATPNTDKQIGCRYIRFVLTVIGGLGASLAVKLFAK